MANDNIFDRAAFKKWQEESSDNGIDAEAFKRIVFKVMKNELTSAERQICILYYHERLTLAEIADLLRVSIPAVCKRLKRIKRTLYGFLKYAAELYYGREMTIAEMER